MRAETGGRALPAGEENPDGPGQSEHARRDQSVRGLPTRRDTGLLDKIEWHYTPKHGSWMNIAETEISIMNSQCLEGRLDSQEKIAAEVTVWESRRNALKARIHWTFSLAAARQKLRKLHPSNENG